MFAEIGEENRMGQFIIRKILISDCSKNRLLYIDVAKGLLIYLVFLGHILDYSSLGSAYIFAMHMPAFFTINGFLGGVATN